MNHFTIKAQYLIELIRIHTIYYYVLLFEYNKDEQVYYINELNEQIQLLIDNGVNRGVIDRVIHCTKKLDLKPYNGYLYDFITLECNIEIIH